MPKDIAAILSELPKGSNQTRHGCKDIAAILNELRQAIDAPAIVSSSDSGRKRLAKPAVVSSADPFKVLISTVLSQRTRDQTTEKAAKQLFAKYPAAKALASAPLYDVRKLIKQAGFFKVKAVRIKEISRHLIERFDGRVPADLQSLLSLYPVLEERRQTAFWFTASSSQPCR